MVSKKHESKDSEDKDESEPHTEERGGFTLAGPFGFGAKFPKSAASESKWIVRAIAVALLILAACYGWSLVK